MKKANSYVLLHILLVVYSLSGVFSKLASNESFMSTKFCLYYGCILLLLVIYAIFWQQIIKRIPLTNAFANKAITVFWGLVWGIIFFHEAISIGKIAGISLIIAGIVLFSISDANEKRRKK